VIFSLDALREITEYIIPTGPTQIISMTSVLIIDDHPFAVQGCRRILEDAGIESVLAAGDLETGYALYQQTRPDMVMVGLALDHTMPILRGRQFAIGRGSL